MWKNLMNKTLEKMKEHLIAIAMSAAAAALIAIAQEITAGTWYQCAAKATPTEVGLLGGALKTGHSALVLSFGKNRII